MKTILKQLNDSVVTLKVNMSQETLVPMTMKIMSLEENYNDIISHCKVVRKEYEATLQDPSTGNCERQAHTIAFANLIHLMTLLEN